MLPSKRQRLSKDSRLPREGLLKKRKDASNCDNAVKKRNSEDWRPPRPREEQEEPEESEAPPGREAGLYREELAQATHPETAHRVYRAVGPLTLVEVLVRAEPEGPNESNSRSSHAFMTYTQYNFFLLLLLEKVTHLFHARSVDFLEIPDSPALQ